MHLPNYYLAKELLIHCFYTKPTCKERDTESIATAMKKLAKSHTITLMKQHDTFYR